MEHRGVKRPSLEEAESARKALGQPFAVEVQWHIAECRLEHAEAMLRSTGRNTDPAILFLRAAIHSRRGDAAMAEKSLRRAVAGAPGFVEAGLALGRVLIQRFQWQEAIDHFDTLLIARPELVEAGLWKGWVQAQLGRFDAAIETTQSLLDRSPADGRIWLNLGHWLKAVGRAAESEAAYRRATRISGTEAAAWWGIANLKGPKFDAGDVRQMEQLLMRSHDPEALVNLHFALAQAFDEAGNYGEGFRHLDEGSSIRLERHGQLAGALIERAQLMRRAFVEPVMQRFCGKGYEATGPIFIVGMPRSGTTLIEHIMASHSQVEALGELPYIEALVRELERGELDFAKAVANLSPRRLKELGNRYVELASVHRQTDRPFFIDKMPSNWLYAGFIKLILPNALIIDARRDPLDCCFSNFRQHFTRGHEFTYSLTHLGETYRAYVSLFGQLEARGQPIVRCKHEDLIENPERSIRELLCSLGFPFETACLRFHENSRSVSTPSALQVRRPINSEGRGRWRNYRQWLEPLFTALGA